MTALVSRFLPQGNFVVITLFTGYHSVAGRTIYFHLISRKRFSCRCRVESEVIFTVIFVKAEEQSRTAKNNANRCPQAQEDSDIFKNPEVSLVNNRFPLILRPTFHEPLIGAVRGKDSSPSALNQLRSTAF